jgi:5-methylcytosine-specific restriction endonuclease McrA
LVDTVKKTEAYLRSLARAREKAAAKAIAEGRTPGQRGQPSKCTAEEKREKHRLRTKKYRAANLEKMRAYHREYERQRAAERAIAEGRIPGRKGRGDVMTDEQRRAKRNALTKKNYHQNIERERARAAKRERDKRAALKAGTYQSKRRRLTDAERKAVNVAWAATRRAMKLKNGGSFSGADVRTLRYRQNGICLYCHRNLGEHDIHVDHWVPLSKGGSNGVENLALLHGTCNLQKGARHPDEFRQSYEVAA